MCTKLKFKRKELGLTGNELAKQLGVAASTISKWENGQLTDAEAGRTDKTKMRNYFDILGVSISEGLHEVTSYHNASERVMNLAGYINSSDPVISRFGNWCKECGWELEEGFNYIATETGAAIISIKNYLRPTDTSFKRYRRRSSKLYNKILDILEIDRALPGVYSDDSAIKPNESENCTYIPITEECTIPSVPISAVSMISGESPIKLNGIQDSDIEWIKDAIFEYAKSHGTRTDYDHHIEVLNKLVNIGG